MKTNHIKYIAITQAILAAALFGMSAPFSKLLLNKLSPYLLSALLYLGAGIGMLIIHFARKMRKVNVVEANLTRHELKYIVLMVILDIIAPILLLIGLANTSSSVASLLNNFEIVATSLIALLIFKETIGKRLWISILFITISSIILSFDDVTSFTFSWSSILILLAAISWGFENNCTRKLSIKDPLQVVIIKGFGSGIGALLIAFYLNDFSISLVYILLALLLGFFAYGLSIYFYVNAQRHLGASRTSAYYAIAPFIGVGLSFIIFQEPIKNSFIIALVIMLLGTYFAINEKHSHIHIHEFIEHEHKHNHVDGHHSHIHDYEVKGEHSHLHTHERLKHIHEHTPDIHHSHSH